MKHGRVAGPMTGHPPTMARNLIHDAKTGARPLVVLLDEARKIPDPSFACEALFGIAQHPKLETKHAAKALTQIAGLLDTIDRPWRRAEVIADLAKRGPRFREHDERIEQALADFQRQLVAATLQLEPESFSQAVPAMARWSPADRMPDLLRKALQGPSAASDAKSVLALGPEPGILDELQRVEDLVLRARLLAYAHSHGAEGLLAPAVETARSLPPGDALEALRAIVAALERPKDLELVSRALPDDAETAARVLCAAAARADKVGLKDVAVQFFDRAEKLAAGLDSKPAASIAKNIAQGRERLAGKAPPKPEVKPMEPVVLPPSKSKRHILALVDTYQGGMSDAHLRALARAAPLCAAFDLDLALVDFPGSAQDIMREAAKNTNIGEGRPYILRLAQEGRIIAVPQVQLGELGIVVATTPKPVPAKDGGLERAVAQRQGRRIVVVMGLGKAGLPGGLLATTDIHWEFTGKNISLETATAMGILAERLHQVPQ